MISMLKKKLYLIYALVMGICSGYAVMLYFAVISRSKAPLNAGDNFWLFVVFFAFFAKLLQDREGKRINNIYLLVSAIGAVAFIVGENFYCSSEPNAMKNILNQNSLVICLACLGYVFLIYFILVFLEKIMDNNIVGEQSYSKLFSKPFWKISIIIFFAWLPYVIGLFPGTIDYDGLYQLRQAMGYDPYTNFSPIFTTILWKLLFTFGQRIGNSENMGLFFCAMFQVFCAIFVLAYMFVRMEKCNIKKWVRTVILLWTCFFSVLPTHALYLNKDSLYSICVLWWVLILTKFCNKHEKKNFLAYVALALSSLLVCLIRHNGIVVVMPTYIVLFSVLLISYLRSREQKNELHEIGRIAGISMLVCVIYFGFTFAVIPVLNIQQQPMRQGFSLLFQGTARYAKYYGNEISEEELDILARVFDTIEREEIITTLSEIYDPETLDSVVRKAKFYNDNYSEFFGLVIKQFIRHPKCYVSAFLNNFYGYFFPYFGSHEGTKGIYGSCCAWQVVPYWPYENDFAGIHDGSYEELREKLKEWTAFKENLPGVGFLYNVGSYFWVMLICCAFIIDKKQYSKLVLLFPSLCTFAVCLISGMNGMVRYALPLFWLNPVLIIWTNMPEQENRGEKTEIIEDSGKDIDIAAQV